MTEKKTHRTAKRPQISARYLAEYMAGSELAKRRIIKRCKFQPIAAVIQHKPAKNIISKAIWTANNDLETEEQRLRDRPTTSDFERDVLEHNADYVARFAKISERLDLSGAEFLPPDSATQHLVLKDVRVNVEINFRLRRLTKTNKIRVDVGALRYAKGKPQSETVTAWHTAFLHGYLRQTNIDEAAEPERKLCVVIDAYAGILYSAPTDARRRFLNMEAACETIAEHWDRIPPPSNAIL